MMPCKHCGQLSANEFYKIYLELNEGDGKIFTIFGRTPQQILEALNFWDKVHYCPTCDNVVDKPCTDKNCNMEFLNKEKLMTREETYKKLDAVDVPNYGRAISSNNLLNALEALGLIKFDEPKETVGEEGIKLSKRPVAWRVMVRLFTSEEDAYNYSVAINKKVEGLYLRDGS